MPRLGFDLKARCKLSNLSHNNFNVHNKLIPSLIWRNYVSKATNKTNNSQIYTPGSILSFNDGKWLIYESAIPYYNSSSIANSMHFGLNIFLTYKLFRYVKQWMYFKTILISPIFIVNSLIWLVSAQDYLSKVTSMYLLEDGRTII